MYTRTSVDDDDGALLLLLLPATHRPGALFARSSTESLPRPVLHIPPLSSSFSSSSSAAPSLPFNKDALHDNALVAVERATRRRHPALLIFPKKLDGDFHVTVILPFAILQSIVARVRLGIP